MAVTEDQCETPEVVRHTLAGCMTAEVTAYNALEAVWDTRTACYGGGLGTDPVGLVLVVVADTGNGLRGG